LSIEEFASAPFLHLSHGETSACPSMLTAPKPRVAQDQGGGVSRAR
jgi:hypothetical protein